MIIEKSFIDWFKKANENEQKSVYNFVIYIFSSMQLRLRIKLAFEIIMGKNYCIYTSKDQKRSDK